MTVLQSTFLVGLAGLLIPVLIHLWSRKNRKPIPFSSIRFITTASQRALRKIRPSDPWLLLLRSVIVLLLVALLSEIRINQWTATAPATIYVDSVYAQHKDALLAIEKAKDTATVIWLPEVVASRRVGTWRKLAKENTVIFSPWNPAASINNQEALEGLVIKRLPGDDRRIQVSGMLVNGETQSLEARLSEKLIQVETTKTEVPLASVTYFLAYDEAYQDQAAVITAACQAIAEQGVFELNAVTDPSEATLFISLQDDSSDYNHEKMLLGRKQQVPWTAWSQQLAYVSLSLTKEAAITSDLVHQLYEWLNPYASSITENDIRQYDGTTLDRLIQSTESPRTLSWLWWSLLLIGIGVERWVALR